MQRQKHKNIQHTITTNGTANSSNPVISYIIYLEAYRLLLLCSIISTTLAIPYTLQQHNDHNKTWPTSQDLGKRGT